MRGNKPKLSADDVRQILAYGASVFLDSSGGGAAGAAAGRVWDAAAVDALIDKSVAEAAAETARKLAAAAAGEDYGGGVDGVFAGLRRWTLDTTDAALAAAEAEWRARYERMQQEGLSRDQAVRLGKGCRVRQPVIQPPAARPGAAQASASSVSGAAFAAPGGLGADIDSDIGDPDSGGDADADSEAEVGSEASASSSGDSLEEDEEFIVKNAPPLRPRAAPARAAVAPCVPPSAALPPDAAAVPDAVLKWAFECSREHARLDHAAAAAAAGVKFIALCAWLSPELLADLSAADRAALIRWVAAAGPPGVPQRVAQSS